jgi:hypothetical protein
MRVTRPMTRLMYFSAKESASDVRVDVSGASRDAGHA